MSNDAYLNTAGTFTCRVERPNNGWLIEVGDKETPCCQIPLVVIGGPQDGKRITWQGWLTDGALSSTVKALHEAFNFEGQWGALVRDPNGFDGLRCRIVTVMETYNGKERCKVRWLNPDGGGAKLDERKATSLIASLEGRSKAVVKDLQQKASSDELPSSTSTASLAEMDSIPFARHDEIY